MSNISIVAYNTAHYHPTAMSERRSIILEVDVCIGPRNAIAVLLSKERKTSLVIVICRVVFVQSYCLDEDNTFTWKSMSSFEMSGAVIIAVWNKTLHRVIVVIH